MDAYMRAGLEIRDAASAAIPCTKVRYNAAPSNLHDLQHPAAVIIPHEAQAMLPAWQQLEVLQL